MRFKTNRFNRAFHSNRVNSAYGEETLGDWADMPTRIHFKDGEGEGGGSGSGEDDAAAAAADAAATADAEAAAAAAAADEGSEDDKSTLSDDEAKRLKEVMKWKQQARDTQKERDDLQAKLAKINSTLGESTLDEVQELINGKKAAEVQELEKRQEYDRIIEATKGEHLKVVDSLNATMAEKDTILSEQAKLIDELTIGRSFSDSVFVRENSTLPASIARKEFDGHFDLVDGRIVAYDKPRGSTDRTPIVDAEGGFKAFELAIADLYARHPESKTLLRSQQRAGSGSKTTEVTTSTTPADKAPVLRGRERIAAALAEQKAK